jgi:hypothetical protein
MAQPFAGIRFTEETELFGFPLILQSKPSREDLLAQQADRNVIAYGRLHALDQEELDIFNPDKPTQQ